MDTRVVLLGIIVENTAAVEELNAICIITAVILSGAWGCPTAKKICILSA